jgi:hypothetical protein
MGRPAPSPSRGGLGRGEASAKTLTSRVQPVSENQISLRFLFIAFTAFAILLD